MSTSDAPVCSGILIYLGYTVSLDVLYIHPSNVESLFHSGPGVRIALYLQPILSVFLVRFSPPDAPGAYWSMTSFRMPARFKPPPLYRRDSLRK
ncbi:hypothetical protein BYT27DRAFT_7250264 [Phlegmacium glaucopus]|nr:hypothetical protein BYT27DRAFT_7250264 [Phlegmacium glaucopus]